MSNVDNEGLRTLDEARAGRPPARFQAGRRLNPGELEEIEAAAQAGKVATPDDVLALVNTISALARRIAKRFNETAQARQDAARARERAESAERALEARGPMADLGHLSDAVTRAERAEREVARLTREVKNRYTAEQVAEYQGAAEEAELVSAPLKRRIEDLERELRCAHVREELLQEAVDDWQRAGHKIADLVWGERVDRAMEDLPPYLGDEADQISAEQEAGGHLVQVINGVREAIARLAPETEGSGGTVDS